MKLNYIVNQIAPISRAENIYSQHEHMACPNGLYRLHVFVYYPKGFYWYIIFSIIENRNKE